MFNLSKLWGSLQLCPPRSYPIIICWYWELAAKITDCIFIKEECQFKNDGTTSFIIGQIPNALTQDGIYHRSDFILSAPYGIEPNFDTLNFFQKSCI